MTMNPEIDQLDEELKDEEYELEDPTDYEEDGDDEDHPGWRYMGLDDTGLPYWHEPVVGFHFS